MNREPNPETWRSIANEGEYMAGKAYNRLVWLMKYDPYTAMLSEHTRTGIANLVFSDKCLGDKYITADTKRLIIWSVSIVLDDSPIARLFTTNFKNLIGELVATSVLAGR